MSSDVIINIIRYIANNFNDKIWPNSAIRDLGMLQSYIVNKKYYFLTVNVWLAILKRSPKLDDTLKVLIRGDQVVFGSNEINKIKPNIFIQYLLIAFTKKHSIELILNSDSHFYDLVVKNKEIETKFLTFKMTYNISQNDLNVILNILKNYLKIDDILSILPTILENYINLREKSRQDFLEEILQMILTFEKKKSIEKKSANGSLKKYQDIYDYTKIPKEILDPLISELSNEERLALQFLFGMNYNEYNIAPKWHTNQEIICRQALQRLQTKYAQIKNSAQNDKVIAKPKTIDVVLNIPFSVCLAAIRKLSETDLRIVKYMFDDDFKGVYDEKKIINTAYKNEWTRAMQNLRSLITVVTLYDYLEIPELLFKKFIFKVPEEWRKSLYLQWNNFNYRYIPYVKLSSEDKENIVKAYDLLKKLANDEKKEKENNVKKEENKKSPQIITIYDYFKATKEILDPIISELPEERKALLKKKFGENYDHYKKKVLWQDKSTKKLYVLTNQFIKRRIISKLKGANKPPIKTIYEYFKTTKEILDPIISELPEERKALLKKKFGENYDHYKKKVLWQDKNTKKLYVLTIQFIKVRINQELRGVNKPPIKTIYEYFKTTKEILDPIISELSEESKAVLKKKFGENYDNYKERVNWQDEEARLYKTYKPILKRIKRKLKNKSTVQTIYDYFKTTKEILDPIISELSEERKIVLKKKFGENYDHYRERISWQDEEEKKLYVLTIQFIKVRINQELRGVKKPPIKTIYDYFKTTKETLDPIINELSEEKKAILKKKFGENYDNYKEIVNWQDEEEKKLYLGTYQFIKRKIKHKLRETANPQITTIYDYFKTTKEILDSIISGLSEERKAVLKKKFDENYDNYKEMVNWQDEEEKKLYLGTYHFIKRKLENKSTVQTIYDYFKTTKEILDPIINKLPEERKDVLKKKFGENYDHYKREMANWQNEEEKKLYLITIRFIKRKIKQKLSDPTNSKIITIYDYFKTTKEILDPIINKLSDEKKAVLKKKFGENYDYYKKEMVNWQDEEEKKLYLITIQFIKRKIIQKLSEPTNSKIITIYEYFKTTREILDPIINELPEERKAVLKKKFGENYDHYKRNVNWQDEEERKLFTLTYAYISAKISYLKRKKNPAKQKQFTDEIINAIIHTRDTSFQTILDELSLQEIVALFLYFKNYSLEDISGFMKIPQVNILDIIYKYEQLNKNMLKDFTTELDYALNNSSKDSLNNGDKLARKKPND